MDMLVERGRKAKFIKEFMERLELSPQEFMELVKFTEEGGDWKVDIARSDKSTTLRIKLSYEKDDHAPNH